MGENQRAVFVKNLCKYLNERGLTQTNIVDALGVSSSTVSDWVKGKKYPRVDAMQRLAEILGVRLSDLTAEDADDALSDGERLLHYMLIREQTSESLASAIGVTAEDVNRMIANDLDPTRAQRKAIARLFSVDESRLFRGEYEDESPEMTPEESELVDIYRDLNATGQNVLLGTARGLHVNTAMLKNEDSTTKLY